MDEKKKTLRGSETRDDFKSRHKQNMPDNCYASDIDLAWVGKKQVLAFFDYKRGSDATNYNERIFYEALSRALAPVYILHEKQDDRFVVSKCVNGEWYWETKTVGWDDLCELRAYLERNERES